MFEVFPLCAGPPVDLIVEALTLLSPTTTIFPLVLKALLVLPVPPLGWSKGVIDDPSLNLLENPFPNMALVIAELFLRESCNLAKKYAAYNVLGLNILIIISNLSKKQLRAYFSPNWALSNNLSKALT